MSISWSELHSTVHINTANSTEAAPENFVCREGGRMMLKCERGFGCTQGYAIRELNNEAAAHMCQILAP